MQVLKLLRSGPESLLVQSCWASASTYNIRSKQACPAVASPAALWIWSCLWLSSASCLTPAWFEGRIRGFAGTLKHSLSSKVQSFCHRALEQPEPDAAVQLPQGCRFNLSPAHSGLVCSQASAQATCRWMTSTYRTLPNQYTPRQWSGKALSSSHHISYSLPSNLSGSVDTLKGCGQSQVYAACRKQIPLPDHSHQHPTEMLKFTWTPSGCRQQDCQHTDTTLLVAPSMLGSGWQNCHDKLSILTPKQLCTQWPISSSQKATLAVSE